MRYADIVVDISNKNLDKVFQYRVLPEMEDRICVGMVVNVPFGQGNRQVAGYVVELSDVPALEALWRQVKEAERHRSKT